MSYIQAANSASIDVSRPGVYLVRVNKAVAQGWMNRNRQNRPIRKQHVRQLAEMMTAGDWIGDKVGMIVFSREGNLIDGQHRLSAIIEADVLVNMRVECGADPSIRDHIDTGRTRSLSDRKSFHDDPFVNKSVAMIIRSISSLQHGSVHVSPRQADEIFEELGPSIVWVAENYTRKKNGLFRAGVLSAFVELHGRCPSLCKQFHAAYSSSDGSIQPARMLRDWMLRSPCGTAQMRDDYERSLAAMVAAFDGRSLQTVRRVEKLPEYVTEIR